MKTMGKVGAILVCITFGCLSFQAVDRAQNSVSKSSTVGKPSMAAAVVPPVTYSGVLPCVACVGREFTCLSVPMASFCCGRFTSAKRKGKTRL